MLKMKGTVCINASKEKSWKVLADIENIPHWSEAVLSAKSIGEKSTGVDAERICKLTNKITIREKWIEWNEGESYTYMGFDLPMVKSARNTWSLTEEEGKTYLTTESEVVLKGGIFGRLLEPIMKLLSDKMGSEALAALKYLIEKGFPYEGKHSKLPKPMATC